MLSIVKQSAKIQQAFDIQLRKDAITLLPIDRPHKFCLIFLHGFAMSIDSLLRIFLSPELIELLSDFKIYIPQSPKRILSYDVFDKDRIGQEVFSWYDLTKNSSVHEPVENIKNIIRKEIAILDNDPSKVFLGGFSQGGALSLYVAHTLEEMIGGVLIVGGFVAKVAKLPSRDKIPPVFIIHGLKDKVKPYDEAKESFGSLLENKNVNIVLLKDMRHDMSSDETRKLMHEFLRTQAK